MQDMVNSDKHKLRTDYDKKKPLYIILVMYQYVVSLQTNDKSIISLDILMQIQKVSHIPLT